MENHNVKATNVFFNEKRLLFFILLIMTLSYRLFANGDPVISYSSINRVANPEPLSISEIKIIHEQINITHVDGYNCFDITYRFKNDSDKDFPEIHYGFPIDYLVSDEQETYTLSSDYFTESMYETGWCDKLIKDISFQFNNTELQFHYAKESMREAGYKVKIYDNGELEDSIPIDAVNRRWFYTKFSMTPKSEATFKVQYKVYANSEIALYGDYNFSKYFRGVNKPYIHLLNHPSLLRYFCSKFTILYDFSPAKHFGNGEAFTIDIDIDLSNLDNPHLMLDGFDCFTMHLKRHYDAVNPGNLKPKNLSINFNPRTDQEYIKRKITPFVISSDKYDVRQSPKTIDIEFHEPTFVSEIICDIDTAIIKSINSNITYANGEVKEVRYIKNTQFECSKEMDLPIVLTITDYYNDSVILNDEINSCYNLPEKLNEPHFKIKKIRLDFETPSTSQSNNLYRSIRILDSRFNN